MQVAALWFLLKYNEVIPWGHSYLNILSTDVL